MYVAGRRIYAPRNDLYYTTPTPSSAAPLLMPLPLAAARLIPIQLNKNPANLKNAIREMERSSLGVREDAKIERRTAGVTGMRLELSAGGAWMGEGGSALVIVLEEEELDMVEDMKNNVANADLLVTTSTTH